MVGLAGPLLSFCRRRTQSGVDNTAPRYCFNSLAASLCTDVLHLFHSQARSAWSSQSYQLVCLSLQKLEKELKRLTERLSRAKYAREGLEQQMKAEEAATETMNRVFNQRRDREKRVAASFSEVVRYWHYFSPCYQLLRFSLEGGHVEITLPNNRGSAFGMGQSHHFFHISKLPRSKVLRERSTP